VPATGGHNHGPVAPTGGSIGGVCGVGSARSTQSNHHQSHSRGPIVHSARTARGVSTAVSSSSSGAGNAASAAAGAAGCVGIDQARSSNGADSSSTLPARSPSSDAGGSKGRRSSTAQTRLQPTSTQVSPATAAASVVEPAQALPPGLQALRSRKTAYVRGERRLGEGCGPRTAGLPMATSSLGYPSATTTSLLSSVPHGTASTLPVAPRKSSAIGSPRPRSPNMSLMAPTTAAPSPQQRPVVPSPVLRSSTTAAIPSPQQRFVATSPTLHSPPARTRSQSDKGNRSGRGGQSLLRRSVAASNARPAANSGVAVSQGGRGSSAATRGIGHATIAESSAGPLASPSGGGCAGTGPRVRQAPGIMRSPGKQPGRNAAALAGTAATVGAVADRKAASPSVASILPNAASGDPERGGSYLEDSNVLLKLGDSQRNAADCNPGGTNAASAAACAASGDLDHVGPPLNDSISLDCTEAKTGLPASALAHREANTVPPASPLAPENNFVERFFREALADGQGAAIASKPRMDVPQYLEKRRVQNALRRVLEAIQERFEGATLEEQPDELGSAFHWLTQHAGVGGDAVESLDEQQFVSALEALSLWAPEWSARDQREVFTAILVPSSAAARALLLDHKLPPRSVSQRQFREGFECVPFNLPENPVPTHLLSSVFRPLDKPTQEQAMSIAQAVANLFSLSRTGVDRMRDFFLCGLISVEEVQTALPRLLPHGIVEDAIVRIIRRGAPLLEPQEWQNLVLGVRTREACGLAPLGTPPSSPWRSAREESGNVDALSVSTNAVVTATATVLTTHGPTREGALDRSDVEDEPDNTLTRFRSRFEPVTEPLPCRSVRREESVSFVHSSTSTAPVSSSRVIDWDTANARRGGRTSVGHRSGADNRSHQADDGAGSRPTWGTSQFKQELAAAASKAAGPDAQAMHGGADPVDWIDVNLHNECGGPYLVDAFARCCQLFAEGRR